MKCKGPIFLTDFKRVYFFTIKGETAVCRNESCLYEVQALQAIINIPLVHVSASALGRSHLAVVENLICACWSIPGAPLWKPSSNSYQRWKSSNRGLRNEGLVRAAPEDNKYTSIFERLQNIMSLINPSLPEEWKENKSGDTRGREKKASTGKTKWIRRAARGVNPLWDQLNGLGPALKEAEYVWNQLFCC